MALLEEAKSYCRTDEDLTSLVSAAEVYLTNAGIAANETNALYCLAVKMLVLHWYDNRGAVTVGTITKTLEYSLQSIISQLKYAVVV